MSEHIYSIEAKQVNKTYKKKRNNLEVQALIDFDINISKGSVYGLLGPNGAGKSTFINILGGLVKKDTGIIKICGINVDTNAKFSRKILSFVVVDPFIVKGSL